MKVKREDGDGMRIGELAHRSGVSRRLLRYYEEQGLLHPVRLPNGYREYTDGDVDAVRRIRVLLDAGLRTAVIAGILDCVAGDGTPYRLTTTGCPGVVARLSREHARITADIDRLDRSRGLLAGLLDTAAPDAATPKDAIPDADVPDGLAPPGDVPRGAAGLSAASGGRWRPRTRRGSR